MSEKPVPTSEPSESATLATEPVKASPKIRGLKPIEASPAPVADGLVEVELLEPALSDGPAAGDLRPAGTVLRVSREYARYLLSLRRCKRPANL